MSYHFQSTSLIFDGKTGLICNYNSSCYSANFCPAHYQLGVTSQIVCSTKIRLCEITYSENANQPRKKKFSSQKSPTKQKKIVAERKILLAEVDLFFWRITYILNIECEILWISERSLHGINHKVLFAIVCETHQHTNHLTSW